MYEVISYRRRNYSFEPAHKEDDIRLASHAQRASDEPDFLSADDTSRPHAGRRRLDARHGVDGGASHARRRLSSAAAGLATLGSVAGIARARCPYPEGYRASPR